MIASIIEFLGAHSVAIAVVVVAVLDFLIAMNPKLESNSIIHLLLSVFKKKPAGGA